MQKYYIRKFENGEIDYFRNEKEYTKKLREELEEILKTNEDLTIENIYDIDHDLKGVIEFNNKNCDTIEDAISELFKNDDTDLLYDYDKYDESIMIDGSKGSITYNIKDTDDYYFNIEFEIVEIDKDDILESKIKNAKLDII